MQRVKRSTRRECETGHDQCRMADTAGVADHRPMDPTQLLAACGLLIGTVDYALLVRRRAAMRRQWREASARQASRASF